MTNRETLLNAFTNACDNASPEWFVNCAACTLTTVDNENRRLGWSESLAIMHARALITTVREKWSHAHTWRAAAGITGDAAPRDIPRPIKETAAALVARVTPDELADLTR